MKNRYFKIVFIAGSLLLVFILGTALFISRKENGDLKDKTDVTKISQYVCSMHPHVIQDKPGDCPICGMFLIEMIEDKNSFDSSLADIVLRVNESVQASVKSIIPEQASLPIIIEAQGIVNFDPGSIRTISARFKGYIERSFVKYQFQYITKGQKIYEIYSPDIYSEQWNYVKLIQALPDRDDLTMEAMEWFNHQGLSKGQIDSLKLANIPDYHFSVYSDAEGFAVSKNFNPRIYDNAGALQVWSGTTGFNDGITVEKGAPLFRLIDVRSLRVDLKVKMEDAPLVERGQKVILTDESYPERQISASIDQIEPFNGGLFQTVKVFIKTDDKDGFFPGKQITARILAGSHDGLWLPATAVVEMGQHRSVFIKKENKYVPSEVRTGVRSNNKIEILYGIDQNSIVAQEALLLVDSDGFINLR
jgi:Cu(I)/Ag(I) efflux system membrane fusion protein